MAIVDYPQASESHAGPAAPALAVPPRAPSACPPPQVQSPRNPLCHSLKTRKCLSSCPPFDLLSFRAQPSEPRVYRGNAALQNNSSNDTRQKEMMPTRIK